MPGEGARRGCPAKARSGRAGPEAAARAPKWARGPGGGARVPSIVMDETPADSRPAPEMRAAGRVLQVNISRGGVPKLPVASAWVGPLGLEGDDHADRAEHGGPHRAVCLYSIEAIRRVQADGHPIFPGSAGENLTLEGIELGELGIGDRLAVGEQLTLEVASACNPCETIRGSFADGRFGRISILSHPRDSRLYARVLQEGAVRPGDPVHVLPPAPDSRARQLALLDRVEAAERSAWKLSWRAAIDAGIDLRLLDDGDLAVAATPSLAATDFNLALGLRQVPHMLPDVLDHFRRHDAVGWLVCENPPWKDALAEQRDAVLTAVPGRVEDRPVLPGLQIREVGHEGAAAWSALLIEGFGMRGELADAWSAVGPGQSRSPKMHLLIAGLDGAAVAAAGWYVHKGVANLGPAAVLPAARRRGIHAALIAARARLAERQGCDLLAAQATLGGQSERDFLRMGFERQMERGYFRFDERAHPAG